MRKALVTTEWEEVWNFGVMTGWRRVCGDGDAIWFEFKGNPELIFVELITMQ